MYFIEHLSAKRNKRFHRPLEEDVENVPNSKRMILKEAQK